ncbi:MAG: extracellular elastinolytic metalloproteinase [Solirubrobacteraceae bacterium]|nr:extracellular elastinolytic metalloproteinase [Solirubrobacteraceae bacterium]
MTRLLSLGVAGALLLPATATAAGRPDFDVRDGLRAPRPTAAVRVARAALRRHAVLRIDPATGTVRALLRRGRALTRPSTASARRVARRYVTAHARALGLDATDIAALGAARVVRAPGGLRTVRLGGAVYGIPSFDSAVTVGIDRSGRVVTVVGAPAHDLSVPSIRPAVSAAAAMAAFAASTGATVGRQTGVKPGPRRETHFGNDFARLVVFVRPGRDRLAWHVSLGGYDGVVDATAGDVLRRHSLVKHAANAAVFPNYPGARAGGSAVTVDLEGEGWLPPGATTLDGPFVHAYADTLSTDDPGVDGEVPRTGAGDFVYPFKNFGNARPRCDVYAACGWDSSAHASWHDNKNQTTAQTFYLDNVWHDHLEAAPIGFDKASGNFADDDPVVAQTDDGANLFPPSPLPLLAPLNLNNANMSTPADGSSPTMQMYLGAYDDVLLFQLFRDYNNGDDAATVFHEYTHGLSSRLVTNADGSEALDSDQAGAMGEDWSDWYAFDYLVRAGLSPDTPAGSEVDIGIYSDVDPHATRTQGLDCPVQTSGASMEPCPGTATAGPGGYTYGDFGKVTDGPEVHADGEIWGETLWDLRTALVASEGGQAPGSDVAEALVTGGMRLSPPEPSMLEARDAIMQTDVALYGGTHMTTLWTVFAARGMGVDASSTGGEDDHPIEDFKLPTAITLPGTLTATPTSVGAGGTVDFDASSFAAGSSFDKGYAWDFDGNGTTDATTASPQTSHVYSAGGSFVAKVTVTDTRLNTGSATAPITVTGGPTPTPTATPGGPGTARLSVPRRGKRGRYAVRVACTPSCVVRVSARLTRPSARALGVRRRLRTRTRTARGTRRLVFKVGRRLRARARARGVHVIRVRIRATAKPAGGATAKRTRTVRVRL